MSGNFILTYTVLYDLLLLSAASVVFDHDDVAILNIVVLAFGAILSRRLHCCLTAKLTHVLVRHDLERV